MNLVNPRPPSCSSRRDKAIDTNRATIGARTSPHAPLEVRLCARVYLTRRRKTPPPPDHRPPPLEFPPSPPVTDTGDSPATRSTRPSQLSICTRPRNLRGTETFVLGRVIAGAHDVCASYALFERSRGTEISVLGRVFSGVQRREIDEQE
uniref:Uncharacterized protein n=1 Tax=Brassica oleracea var. oleracea TaxID=109376 RepID=A0A0D3CI89_BRAOL